MENALSALERALWSGPLPLFILGTGLYLLLRLRGFPLRNLPLGLRLTLRGRGSGGVSPFAALCTSLSASIGTGNIVGVAGAVVLGGPGALFWMWLSAILGLSVKYAEGLLAVKYRRRQGSGWGGGPFVYIADGLGPRFLPLARVFAVLGAAAGLFGVGTLVQMNGVGEGLRWYLNAFFPEAGAQISVFGRTCPLALPVCGCVLGVLAAAVLFGGVRRISSVSAVLVPCMTVLYLGCCAFILLRFGYNLPAVLLSVFRGAWNGRAAAGGFWGTVQAGVSRGVFSNEAGLGTAPIAAAAAETDSPVRQGLVCMTGNVFDTLIVCTFTGLAILCTGVSSSGPAGIGTTLTAFAAGLPFPRAVSAGLVLGCLTLFAFTTVIAWDYYGTQCLRFLTGNSRAALTIYHTLYLLSVPAAPLLSSASVWSLAMVCNGLMALPNLTALLLLAPAVRAETLSFANHNLRHRGIYGDHLSGPFSGRLRQTAPRSVHRRAGRTAGPAARTLSNAER